MKYVICGTHFCSLQLSAFIRFSSRPMASTVLYGTSVCLIQPFKGAIKHGASQSRIILTLTRTFYYIILFLKFPPLLSLKDKKFVQIGLAFRGISNSSLGMFDNIEWDVWSRDWEWMNFTGWKMVKVSCPSHWKEAGRQQGMSNFKTNIFTKPPWKWYCK